MPKENHRFREEVVNVELARALTRRGLAANPETIVAGRKLPDVLVDLGGLKLILEGRQVAQRAALFKDAADRVTLGIADISMAVLYPADLPSASSQSALERKVERGTYSGAVFHLTREGITAREFTDATVDTLAELINSAFRLVVQNDVVRDHVSRIEAAINGIVADALTSDLFFRSDVLIRRLQDALGIDSEGASGTASEEDS